MPDFVTLTLVSNSAQVVLVPFLSDGLWWIAAAAGRYIGEEHRNRWWENAVMGVLFALAMYGAFEGGGDGSGCAASSGELAH